MVIWANLVLTGVQSILYSYIIELYNVLWSAQLMRLWAATSAKYLLQLYLGSCRGCSPRPTGSSMGSKLLSCPETPLCGA